MDPFVKIFFLFALIFYLITAYGVAMSRYEHRIEEEIEPSLWDCFLCGLIWPMVLIMAVFMVKDE
jgi:hypothetical protein